jgi:tRNA A58 N-methylase Trm61
MRRLLTLPVCIAFLGLQALLGAGIMVLSVSAPGDDCGTESDSWFVRNEPEDSGLPKTRGILAALALTPGMTIAQVPAQRGDWTVMLAREVGPEGRVLSGNVIPDCDTAARAAISQAGLQNVTQFRSGWFSFDFPGENLDRILVVDSPHMRTSPFGKYRWFVRELWDALAPQGRVVVFKDGCSPGSPSAEELVGAMGEVGFEIVSEADPETLEFPERAAPASQRCRSLLVAVKP